MLNLKYGLRRWGSSSEGLAGSSDAVETIEFAFGFRKMRILFAIWLITLPTLDTGTLLIIADSSCNRVKKQILAACRENIYTPHPRLDFPRSGHAAIYHIARLYFGDAFIYCDANPPLYCTYESLLANPQARVREILTFLSTWQSWVCLLSKKEFKHLFHRQPAFAPPFDPTKKTWRARGPGNPETLRVHRRRRAGASGE